MTQFSAQFAMNFEKVVATYTLCPNEPVKFELQRKRRETAFWPKFAIENRCKPKTIVRFGFEDVLERLVHPIVP